MLINDPLQLMEGESMGQFVRRGIVIVFTRLAEQLNNVEMSSEAEALGIPFTLFLGQERVLGAWERHCKEVGERC